MDPITILVMYGIGRLASGAAKAVATEIGGEKAGRFAGTAAGLITAVVLGAGADNGDPGIADASQDASASDA